MDSKYKENIVISSDYQALIKSLTENIDEGVQSA